MLSLLIVAGGCAAGGLAAGYLLGRRNTRRRGSGQDRSVDAAVAEVMTQWTDQVVVPWLEQRLNLFDQEVGRKVNAALQAIPPAPEPQPQGDFVTRDDLYQVLQQVATHKEVEAATQAVIQRLAPASSNGQVAALQQRLESMSQQLGLQ